MFANKEISPYWFQTVSPTILFDFFKLQIASTVFPKQCEMSDFDYYTADIENTKLKMLMFQTGYLTVEKYILPSNYLLRCPNQEVNITLDKDLLYYLLGQEDPVINGLKAQIMEALDKYDSDSLQDAFHKILSWFRYPELQSLEYYNQGIIFTVLKALSFTLNYERTFFQRNDFDILLTLNNKVAFVCASKNAKFDLENHLSEENEGITIDKFLKSTLKLAVDKISFRDYSKELIDKYEVVKKIAIAFVGNNHVKLLFYH
jgi:hypothetical protein